MIKPYLSNIINNNKTKGEWKVHSDDTAISYKTQREWKFQLKLIHMYVFFYISTYVNFLRKKRKKILS